MSRFSFPGKRAIRPQNGNGKTLAYFDFVDNETGLEYRDFRLIESGNGNVFVASPYRSYEKDGQTKYNDYIRPAWDGEGRSEDGVAWFEELADAVYAEYEKVKEEVEAKRQRRSVKAGSTGKKSGRGPVRRPPTVDPDDDDDDLPF